MKNSNIVFHKVRLNMSNPVHKKINSVINQLDRKSCKSINKFFLDAAIYYIEHFGKEAFIEEVEIQEDDEMIVVRRAEFKEYISKQDKLMKEIKEQSVEAARIEVIKLLGNVLAGAGNQISMQNDVKSTVSAQKTMSNSDVTYLDKTNEDDEVLSSLACSWMEN